MLFHALHIKGILRSCRIKVAGMENLTTSRQKAYISSWSFSSEGAFQFGYSFGSFFQAAVVSILLYGCTNWTLTKLLEKKLDGNYTRMLRAILNKSWRQHPTRHPLYGHQPPTTKTIQVRRTRHAGHCWRSRHELISDVLLWTPHMAEQNLDDQLERTYSSYVRIRDVALKTCQRRWTIERSGERGSEISVLAARHDDDDDIFIHIYILYGTGQWNKVRNWPWAGACMEFAVRTTSLE